MMRGPFGHSTATRAAALVAACVVGWAWIPACPASADDHVRLDYVRTADALSCPDAASLRAFVVGRLGSDPFADTGQWSIRIVVQATADGYAASLALVDPSATLVGEREVASAGRRCEDLVEAMALTLSVILETVRDANASRLPAEVVDPPAETMGVPDDVTTRNVIEPAESTGDESGLRLASPRVLEAPSVAPPAPTPAAPSPVWTLGAGAVVGRGELPSIDVAVELVAKVRIRAASGLLAMNLGWPRSTERLPTGGFARLGLVRLTTGACGHVGVLGLCGVIALRGYFGAGHDVAFPSDDFQLAVGIGARADLEIWRHGAFVLEARAEVLGAARRAEARLDAMRVFLEPAWSGNVGALVCWELR